MREKNEAAKFYSSRDRLKKIANSKLTSSFAGRLRDWSKKPESCDPRPVSFEVGVDEEMGRP